MLLSTSPGRYVCTVCGRVQPTTASVQNASSWSSSNGIRNSCSDKVATTRRDRYWKTCRTGPFGNVRSSCSPTDEQLTGADIFHHGTGRGPHGAINDGDNETVSDIKKSKDPDRCDRYGAAGYRRSSGPPVDDGVQAGKAVSLVAFRAVEYRSIIVAAAGRRI